MDVFDLVVSCLVVVVPEVIVVEVDTRQKRNLPRFPSLLRWKRTFRPGGGLAS